MTEETKELSWGDKYILKNYPNDLDEQIYKDVQFVLEEVKKINKQPTSSKKSELSDKVAKKAKELRDVTRKHIQDLISNYHAMQLRKKYENVT